MPLYGLKKSELLHSMNKLSYGDLLDQFRPVGETSLLLLPTGAWLASIYLQDVFFLTTRPQDQHYLHFTVELW